MAFKDYSNTPASNTTLGGGQYIGPNMLRNVVRPSLQQLAADGRDLYDEMIARGTGVAPAFIASGVGAVERSTQNKLRDAPATPEDYGAIGDGVTNDTANFAKALATGKDIFLPEGRTYAISNLTGFVNHQRIFGPGKLAKHGATLEPMMTLPDEIDGLTFDGIEIDGRKDTYAFAFGSNVPAILGYLTKSINVVNCYFHDVIDSAIKLRDGANLYAAGNRFVDCMENCIELHNYDLDVRTGTEYVGTRPVIEGNSTIIGNEFKGSTRLETTTMADASAIGIMANSTATAWSAATAYVIGNYASRLGVTYRAILGHTNQQPPNVTYWVALPTIPRNANIRIVGNHIENCLRGIFTESNEAGIESRNIVVADNTFDCSGTTADGVYVKNGIVANGTQGMIISGNTFRNYGNHELTDPADITTCAIAVSGSPGINDTRDIQIVDNYIIDDTGGAERTEHAIYLAAGTNITIRGNRGSGMRTSFIQINAAANDVRCTDNPGGTGAQAWAGPVAVYEFGFDNLPASATTTLLHDQHTAMDDLYMPAAGRIVAVEARLSESPGAGTVEIRPRVAGVLETGAYVLPADFFGATRGYKEVVDVSAATQIAKGAAIDCFAVTSGLPTATNDIRVKIYIDHGWQK